MRVLVRTLTVIGLVVGIEVGMVFFIIFHLGWSAWQFTQLTGALIGGTLTLVSVNIPIRREGAAEPWLERERFGWILIGFGLIMWGVGESFWRYYIYLGQPPFPSLADIGYSSLPPLVFIGLLLQPSSGSGRRRLLVLLDSLIAMGSMLAIAWYLLLGSLALNSTVEDPLAKFLGLYYPTSDIPLLTCVVLLLLRGRGRLYQATARRISLLLVGLGLCFFVTSDFIFNVQQNAGAYVDGTWVDLGWPLGMLTIGLAAYLRRILPATSPDLLEQRIRRRAERVTFGPEQLVPYLLVALLFVVLVINVLSSDDGQRALRPVLLFATIGVVGLVLVRQILTIVDNERMARRQANALRRLGLANQRVEDQARQIAEHNAELEMGVTHLKDIQARLANGDLRARARLASGELLPLAASLNLMADRLMRLEQIGLYSQRLARALADLSVAIERYRIGGPFIVPPSCHDFAEINRLLLAMGVKEHLQAPPPSASPTTSGPLTQPVSPRQPSPQQTPVTQPVSSHQPWTQQAPVTQSVSSRQPGTQQTWPGSQQRS